MSRTLGICLLIICFALTVFGQCSVDNGGCSHYCLDHGSNVRTCGCPCLMSLDVDNSTCIADLPCDIDLLILADLSILADPSDCPFIAIDVIPKLWSTWMVWRNHIANVEGFFVVDNNTTRTNVGVQYFADRTTYENVHDYMSLNLNEEVATLSARATPLCSGMIHYAHFLSLDIENNIAISNHMYLGPGERRDPLTTSYLAIVMAAGAVDISNSNLASRLTQIYTGFDQIIVISKQNGSGVDVVRNNEINRFVSCGSTTTIPCDTYFYVDALNDNGLDVTEANIKNVMSVDGCLARQLEASPIIATVECQEQIILTIPKCLLKGLFPEELTYTDPSCAIAYVDDGSNIKVTIPFVGSGIITRRVAGGTEFFMLVTTTNAVGVVLPNLTFEANCTYPEVTAAPPADLFPVNQMATDDMATSFYDLAFQISLTNDMQNPLPPNSDITVDCPVYLWATSTLPSMFRLQLISCVATPSATITDPSDANAYTLAALGCPVDSTFTISPQSNTDLLEFNFEFFEFLLTYKDPAASKLPVFVHCTFTACKIGDNSLRCNPSCGAGRKRRTVDEEEGENVIVRTLGPFHIAEEENSNSGNVRLEIGQNYGSVLGFSFFDNLAIMIVAMAMLAMALFTMKSRVSAGATKFASTAHGAIPIDLPPKYDIDALVKQSEERKTQI